MHARKKGKSGSTKPTKKTKKSWVRYKPKEIEHIILRLAKTGKTSSQIGLIMRDTYGVPDIKTITGNTITQILDKNKLLPQLPEDMIALIKKEIKVIKHLESNKKDISSKRGLQLIESKIRRLIKYYKKTGKLPLDWEYDREKVKLLIE